MSKMVDRTLDFLELFAKEKRPLSLSDISRLLRIPKSSCHDVLSTFERRGYLYEPSPRDGFYPTLRLLKVGKEIVDNDPLIARAQRVLGAVRDTLDESVLLSMVSGLNAIYILTLEPTHPLRVLVNVGDNVRSLHATSAGKALLANLDEPALKAFLKAAKLPRLTKKTVTSAAALAKEIAAGREQGWFLNQEQSLESVTTVSATFKWSATDYIVTVAGPSVRMEEKLKRSISEILRACRTLESMNGLPFPQRSQRG